MEYVGTAASAVRWSEAPPSFGCIGQTQPFPEQWIANDIRDRHFWISRRKLLKSGALDAKNRYGMSQNIDFKDLIDKIFDSKELATPLCFRRLPPQTLLDSCAHFVDCASLSFLGKGYSSQFLEIFGE